MQHVFEIARDAPARPDPGTGSVTWIVLSAHAVMTAAFVATLLGASGAAVPPDSLLTPLSILQLGLCAWMVMSWKMTGAPLLDPYGLFMMASFPFHAGYAVLRLLGEEWPMVVLARVSDAATARTLLLVTGCLLALHLGALIARAWPSRPSAGAPDRATDPDMVLAGSAFLAVSFVPAALELRALVEAVMAGGYLEVFLAQSRGGGGLAALLSIVAPFFVPGCLFIVAGSGGNAAARWLALGALTLYSAAYLFVGFRAFALLPLVALVWVWHRAVRPLPVVAFGAAGGTALLFISVIVRAFRGLSGTDRLSLSSIESVVMARDTPLYDLVSELGASMFTVTFTTELVPHDRPFEWGMTYVRSLLHAIPIVDIPNGYGYAGDWLARELRPEWADQGFSYGFSFIAEAYLNFGWLGAPLVVLLLGLGIARLGMWVAGSNDRARLAFVASFLPLLVFSVRGESIALARPVLWHALLPFAAVLLLRRLRQRSLVPPESP